MVTKVRGSGRDHSAYRPQKLFLLATKWRIPLSSCLSRGEKTVKVSDGEDVCSAEIERVLLSHPEVQDAVVLGVPDSKWREVDAAYLVARKQGGIAPEIILEFVNTRLARHKLPNEICFLDSLPPNASEAINKGPVAGQVPLCGCSPILGDTEHDLPADSRSGGKVQLAGASKTDPLGELKSHCRAPSPTPH
jgi:hypothetical protein